MTERPTSEAPRHERIALVLTAVDTAMLGLFVAAALATASLSLMGEAIRSGLFVVVQIYGLCALRPANWGGPGRFEYGTGKLERTVGVAVGAGLSIGSFWMIDQMFELAFGVREAAQPIGLAAASLMNAAGLTARYAERRLTRQVLRDAAPPTMAADLIAREDMFRGSIGVQFFLTAAALAWDAEIAVLFDILGAAFLAVLMFRRSIKLLIQSLPHLLDAPASDDEQHLIAEVAGSVLPADEVVDIRTRLNGTAIEAEIALTGATGRPASDLCRWTTDIEHALHAHGVDVDVAVVVSKKDGTQPGMPGNTF